MTGIIRAGTGSDGAMKSRRPKGQLRRLDTPEERRWRRPALRVPRTAPGDILTKVAPMRRIVR